MKGIDQIFNKLVAIDGLIFFGKKFTGEKLNRMTKRLYKQM
ncbi:Uncharacterised protein [Enterococcus hirae]|nr:Uncharacterised protein [Enterococcus hirae]